MIKVALVDDHCLIRNAIKLIIEANKEFVVVAEASNGKEFIELLNNECHPEILILDINMPVMNGFETAKFIKGYYPQIKIIALSLLRDEDAIFNMIRLGACGYITKNEEPEVFIKTILEVYNIGTYFKNLKNNVLFQSCVEITNKNYLMHKGSKITDKEITFIQYCSVGYGYKKIASLMNASPKTIENYRDSLFEKLNVNNKTELILYSIKSGLINIF